MLPLSQDELAGWTGASREAVSKALRSLRDRGLLETGRRRVIIYDLDGLRESPERPGEVRLAGLPRHRAWG